MVIESGKWLSSAGNGCLDWEMVFLTGKWFSRLGNGCQVWEVVVESEKPL